MGEASNKKKQRAHQRRDRPHLLRKVSEQRELLRVLGETFDNGSRVAGYPLSTAIRVLVHDTERSASLLGQTGDLPAMSFLDTSLPLNPRSLISHNGLAILRLTAGQGATWVPRVSAAGPPVPHAEPRYVSFGTWWKAKVTKDAAGILWSRARIVLETANKEGGAHIDPQQTVEVRRIEEENSMGWRYHDPIVGDQPMAEGPLMPSIRQIAHELDTSIAAHFGSELGLPGV